MAAHQWQRVAREITGALYSGEFKPGDQLPPRAVLARRWGVSAAVAGTAFDHLTAGGVLRHGQDGRNYAAAGPGQRPGPAAGGQAPAFLTVAEVAPQARVSKATIYRLIRDGTIRSVRIGSNRRIDVGSWYARFNGTRLPARHVAPSSPPGRPGPAAVPAVEIARLYGLGLTISEISGLYEVSTSVISSRLDHAGITRRAPGERDGGLPAGRAVSRYRSQPDLLAELAAGLGIPPQILAGRPATGRGQGIYQAGIRAVDVAVLYRAGWTRTQLAGRYRTTPGTIQHRLEQEGVTWRKNRSPGPARPPAARQRPRARPRRGQAGRAARGRLESWVSPRAVSPAPVWLRGPGDGGAAPAGATPPGPPASRSPSPGEVPVPVRGCWCTPGRGR